jgi:beta-fructofuranosidase
VGDAGRPQLHLTAVGGWVNDPLGLTFHDGQYHLFFQHVPSATAWAPGCQWGHATSPDLVRWSERPVALPPGAGDDGCWSGSIAVADDGRPVLFYTSVTVPDVHIGRVRTARPVDRTWDAWVKQDVVARLPSGVDAVAFRDPYVYRDGGRWRMLVGAGLKDGTATVLGYVSDDLDAWEYDGPLVSRSTHETEPEWTGSLWECPQLFAMGEAQVLLVSVWHAGVLHHVACSVGSVSGGRFTPRTWQRLTYGPCYYAGSAFADEHGRRGLMLWLRDIRDAGGRWTGALSLPHRLELDGHTVRSAPHPHLDAYRNSSPAGPDDLATAADLEWVPTADARLHLRTADDETVVEVRAQVGELTVACAVTGSAWSMPWRPGSLRLVLDGPVLEVFGASGVMAVAVAAAGAPLRPVCRPGDGSLQWWPLGGP